MKRAWNIISNILVCLLALVAVSIMIFTLISVTAFDRNDRTLFGYRMLVVLSDSMSATDFKAGDLIFVKETDPQKLKEGDIISYVSQDPGNYGVTVTHKIRRATTDAEGNPGFVTYGTTTGIDDPVIVTWSDILGRYRMRLPGAGTFFSFLKTVPGYILFILLPFMILIITRTLSCVRLFREYKEEELAEIVDQREKLKEDQETARRMMERLDGLKAQMEAAGIAFDDFDDMSGIVTETAEDASGKGVRESDG